MKEIYDEDEDLFDDDYCYECGGYGDDYYINDEGELICNCDDCCHNHREDDE